MQDRPGGPEVRSVYRRRNFSGKAFARRLRWHLLKSQGGSPSPAWKISCAPASPLASGVFPAWHLMSQHGLSGRQSKGLAARVIFCIKGARSRKNPCAGMKSSLPVSIWFLRFRPTHDSCGFYVRRRHPVVGKSCEGSGIFWQNDQKLLLQTPRIDKKEQQ